MKYFKNKLSNGSSLSTITIPNAPSITVTSYIKAGFRSDPDGMPGLAHCTEHMLFAGSEKFPSHYILASNVEKVGGWHYAYTWIDYQQ
ncbi:MAG TPA: insulinase family protein, partial [Patescibacteria group bacterium]